MWHSVAVADFSINENSVDSGCTVLGLAGNLDLASASTMRAAGLAALAQPNLSTLVLDVTSLRLIDSTGIGSLVELHNHAQQHDQRMVLRGVSANLTRVLTIAGLASFFNFDPPEGDHA
jgi:anti-sigma B factor antagonist